MASIDTHSDTWRQIQQWAAEEREELVYQLIAGSANDDRLRGRIDQIDNLLRLGAKPDPTIPSPTY
ncbi:hypothetical protein [Halomonas sp. IOP_31]|uniref:hypothetical protein n=1 Tax=Halomonas sp. IOP_31 TaxID=2876584 RepID=UPI001E58FFB8|nr:hypothetical protein [Halomonas sp. IOP_31]MCD6006902.1 hypothetical protein [Halomonas sp. IOP_31]